MVSRRVAVVAVCMCAVVLGPTWTGSASEPSVTGVLEANGETVELPYVYVWAEEEGFFEPEDPTWTLLFVDREIEERELDGMLWGAAFVELKITETAEFTDAPELTVYGQNIRFSADTPGNISGGSYPELEVTTFGPDQFEGRVYHAEPQEFFDDVFRFDFTFAAPLSDPNRPIGDPLPAGGGEPGAAYMALVEAIHAGDLERLKALAPSDQAEMLGDEDAAEMLEMIQMMTPKDIEIVSGSSDGSLAILKVSGTMDGQPASGTITLERQDDRWVPTSSQWQ